MQEATLDMPNESSGIINAIIAGVAAIVVAAVTAVFTWLYQRKQASASLLSSFVKDAFERQKRAEERQDIADSDRAVLKANYEAVMEEVKLLRQAKHDMRDTLQQMQLEHEHQILQMQDLHRQEIAEMQRIHQAQIEGYEKQIRELNERMAYLEGKQSDNQ